MITSSIQDILMMYAWEDDQDINTTDEIVEYGRPKLFDFSYPLYDSNLKEQFELDFIRHFYMREIGSESIALFKLRLQDYLYLNHEKWERLYQSVDDSINPFTNVDIRTKRSTDESEQTDRDTKEDEGNTSERKRQEQEDSKNKQTNKISSHADDFTRNLEQTPPDERLSITARDGVGLIEYASEIAESKNINDSQQQSNVDGTTGRTNTGSEEETRDRTRNELEQQLRAFEQALDEHKVGRNWQKSFVEIYDEYIREFQGIHQAMFKDMEKLFLGVF